MSSSRLPTGPQMPADPLFFTRRQMLTRCGTGLGMLGLAGVLADDGLLGGHSAAAAEGQPVAGISGAGAAKLPLAPRAPHFPGKAKQVVHLFMNGGPSHVDTFDPKPLLDKYHGKPLPAPNLRTERKTGARHALAVHVPPATARAASRSASCSPQTAAHIDDMCVIRSMHADVPNHEPSLMLMNCGDGRLPRPSMGSWITYGLGTENQNLPGFIAMCPGGYPIVATQNWRSAFLPGAYQGTYIDTQHTDIEQAHREHPQQRAQPLAEQRRQLDLVRRLNEQHLRERRQRRRRSSKPASQSFELAYRMQTEATDAFDIRTASR